MNLRIPYSILRSGLAALHLLLFLSMAGDAMATHIVGGEMTYKCIGGNNYEIRLDLYRDCLSGDAGAIAEDVPAYFGVFTGNGALVTTSQNIQPSGEIQVPKNFTNECVLNPPNTCLNRITFKATYNLPPNASGYYIVYERCCRNGSILNIANPSSVGATYYCFIPPTGGTSCNNSAVFKEYPPQIVCVNNPLVYDHSATDFDGDSLSYEFCQSYVGGSPNDPKPIPNNINLQPVTYLQPFTAVKPMAGNPQIQIDPVTGVITGTPNIQGRFVVSVCCHEWRNGVKINTVTREFQFVVTNCSKAVVANIPQFSTEPNTYIVECNGKTVHFVNQSTGANESGGYFWDFGVPGTDADTSTEFQPTFTYPDTGVYRVTLYVNRNSTCPDSISRLVKVYPTFVVDFNYNGLPCPSAPIQFNELIQSTYLPISEYAWSFGDGSNVVNAPNTTHAFAQGGDYIVTLSAANAKGCRDTAQQLVHVQQFKPFAGNDTIIVKGESIVFNATGGDYYTWSPATHLNTTEGANPIGYYPDTTRLDYVVFIRSEAGCTGYDTINVWVVGQGALLVPNAFTPNGDGHNDYLRPIGIGYREVKSFRVFNRFGQEVFTGNNFERGWDGTFNGKPADMGTYFWSLDIVDRFGKRLLEKGDVVLIR